MSIFRTGSAMSLVSSVMLPIYLPTQTFPHHLDLSDKILYNYVSLNYIKEETIAK